MQSGFLNWFPFDPLNLNSPANQVKEVKNGRLAMVTTFSLLPIQFLLPSQHPRNSLCAIIPGNVAVFAKHALR